MRPVAVRPRRQPAASATSLSLLRTPRARSLLLMGLVGGVGAAAWLAAHAYTDLLWFRELGQERVFWTTLRWKLLAAGFASLGTTCFVLANLAVVDRVMGDRSGTAHPWPRVALAWPYRRLLFPVLAIGCGALSATWAGDGAWSRLALWSHRVDFGVPDPRFHRDVGFFVFSLPLYQQVARWLLLTLALAAVATVAAYLTAGGIRIAKPRVVAGAARRHLLILAALALVVTAWRYRLDQFALELPRDGARPPGAGYIDVHVRLPLLRVLAVVSLASAALCLYAAWRGLLRLPLAGAAALGILAIVGQSALPALVDRIGVQPQELTREKPYLADALVATKRAFALDRVEQRPLSGSGRLTAAGMAAGRTTLDNVPLWDGGVLRPAMNELQSIAQYYRFPTTTVDRYTIDGAPRLVTVAARELDRGRLRRTTRGWATDRFAYTHGYGVVAVQASRSDADRHPWFVQRGFRSPQNPLRLRDPRIYFGQQPESDPPYMVIGTGRGEIDAPGPGSQPSEYHYDGPGGIALSNPLRRIAFAARFGDVKLLLTDTIDASSRIVLHRDAAERVRTLAPFLRWDARPQTAVLNGRVTYLFHGYTTSASYPYSAKVRFGSERVNYVRAAATAAVDAFSGRVSLYAADREEDPIVQAWRGAYPGLFHPASQMPQSLKAHLRYPRALFQAQARAYETYHADNPTGFWNEADAWQRPLQLAGPVERVGEVHFPDAARAIDPDEKRENGLTPDSLQMRPDYLLARLPGETSERLLLTMAFTPRGRQNLSAYLAGSIDDRGRPRLTLLDLRRDQLTVGPSQATRRILEAPVVNKRIDLLNKESRDLGNAAINRTILGVPRLVPVGGTLVQVQPIYLAAAGGGVPSLQLVTAYANGRVGAGPDVETALRDTLSR